MLYNKDGSVYRLAGPNPAMKDQKLWNDFVIHNMDWTSESSKDTTEIKPLDSDFFVKNTFFDDLKETKPEIKVTEIKVTETRPESKVAEIKVTEIKSEPSEPLSAKTVTQHDPENDVVPDDHIEKIFVHCLPAQMRERRDTLYGDVYKTLKYSSPISFEAILVSQTDYFIELWTDADKISIGSVLYPKMGSKRWWRVQEKTQKGNGWILKSMPSDYHPSFE